MDNKDWNISEKYKFIWVAPEKNATQTTAQILSLYGCKFKDIPIYTPVHRLPYHFTTKSTNTDFPSDYTVLVNVRNPYGRVYSLFKTHFNKVFLKNKENFKKFLYDGIYFSGIVDKAIQPKVLPPNFKAIRFENLYEDLKSLPFIYENITDKQLKLFTDWHIPPTPWEKYYDDESKKMVYKLCEHQFEMFGYEK